MFIQLLKGVTVTTIIRPGPDGLYDQGGPETIPVAVSSTLCKALEGMNEDHQHEALAMLDGALQACLSLHEAKAPMGAKVEAIHSEIDEVIARDRAKLNGPDMPEIKCREGCGSCCKIPVSVSFPEAEILLGQAKTLGITLDEGRLYRQAQAVGNPDLWRNLSDEDRVCPFLSETNSCRVYKFRPSACRKYFSVTDPEYCNDKKHPGHQVGVWYSLRAEVIESAAMSVFGVGYMPDQLIKAMKVT